MKKKNTTRITVIFVLMIVAMVGYYAYLSGRAKDNANDTGMTLVMETLSRDLYLDYPATPKEVIKYYNQILQCYYNEECTDEEIESLGIKARELYDKDLLAANELGKYLISLKNDIEASKEKKRVITSASVAASTSVDEYTVNGYRFARIHCGYNFMEGGTSKPTNLVYLLRKDSDKHWKIYGWDLAENLTINKDKQADNQ